MKLIIFLSLIWISSGNATPMNHGFLVFGSREIYATHIVNKKPHNWQATLSINPFIGAADVYFKTREKFPNDQIIFVAKDLEISNIKNLSRIWGNLIRLDSSGNKQEIFSGIILERDEFKVLYLKELTATEQFSKCTFNPDWCL